jgi:hypothetical protein
VFLLCLLMFHGLFWSPCGAYACEWVLFVSPLERFLNWPLRSAVASLWVWQSKEPSPKIVSLSTLWSILVSLAIAREVVFGFVSCVTYPCVLCY